MTRLLKHLLLPALVATLATTASAADKSFSFRNDTGSECLLFVDNWVHSAQKAKPGETLKFRSASFHSVSVVVIKDGKATLIQSPYNAIRPGKEICNQNDNFLVTTNGVALWK
jgi:hypothetical protein